MYINFLKIIVSYLDKRDLLYLLQNFFAVNMQISMLKLLV